MTTETDLTALAAALDRYHTLLSTPEPALEDALTALDRSRDQAHLAILGPESAGKSTLVNALVDAEISPVSIAMPGTVAPVHVLHAKVEHPRYRVLRTDGSGNRVTEEPADRAAFERWMLQEHNEDNVLEVLRGEIRLPAPMLAGGLRLVDHPGLSGVSRAVAAQAERDLAGKAFTVVLVSMGRLSLKALADTVRDLADSPRPARIAAVLFNEYDSRLLTPERLPAHLAMRRESVTKFLVPLDTDGRLGLADASLHCIDLSAPDERQLDVLRARITVSVRQEVDRTVAETSRYTLPVLDAALERRARRVHAVLDGDMDRAEIGRHADEALAGLDTGGLSALFGFGRTRFNRTDQLNAVEAARRAEDWQAVKGVFLEENARLTGLVDGHLRDLNPELLIDKHRAKTISKAVEGQIAVTRRRIAEACAPGLRALGLDLDAVAREREALFDSLVPTGLHRTRPRNRQDSEMEVGSYRYESAYERYERGVKEYDDSVLFNIGAFLYLVPLHYLGGGHLMHVQRRLREARQQTVDLLAAPEGGQAKAWLRQRRQLVGLVREEIGDRITLLAGTAADHPEKLVAGLRSHQDRITEARGELDGWRRTLEAAGARQTSKVAPPP
ncbi:dynamin family protein [Streptomyces sp. NPDC098101]|uniref:dynamin family protein n=1 Tax=Streptomyces sp. NPDC098101 TaxID=3366096 RepID=UPI003826B7CC